MPELKMKNQSVFWIAVFSILVQVLGQIDSTTTDPPKSCVSPSEYPKSCSDFEYESGSIGNSSELQSCSIYPHGNGTKVEVLCDFEVDGGGWTLIQKRSSGPSLDFHRNWNEYAAGFGSLGGNFWIGLDNIHALTQNGDQELRIQLEDFQGEKRWAKYSNFSISDASDYYRLSIGGFSGGAMAGDSMTNPNYFNSNNGMRFTTKDMDNDRYSDINCADYGENGGWWFNSCGYSWLNGKYPEKGEIVYETESIIWYSWTGWTKPLAKTEMKIRRKKSV